MEEDVIRFGTDDSMVGIMTRGDGSQPSKLGCILPNIGLAHRIGPHRLNVKIARRLAQIGVSTMRFDLSGVGDNPNLKTSHGVIDQAVEDMRDAMNHMEKTSGIKRFIVFGICSGAQNGYFLALNDERITGILMYDGFDFPSMRSKLEYNIHQFRSTSWPDIGKKIRNRVLPRSAKKSEDIFATALDEMHPTRDQFRAAMEKLLARRVSICTFYSGSRRARDAGRGLLGGLGDPALLDKITYTFDSEMDHTATSHASQQRLLSYISDWATQVAAK